jgi:LysM repeat protein
MRLMPILTIVSLFLSGFVWAQPSLEVKGSTPDLYLQHKVEPKETWFSVGRLYNLHPRDIAPFNNTDLNNGLKIGQDLKIPLRAANFSQDEKKAADEVLVPVYHVVAEGEWMFRVSTNHNKVALEKLEKWNGITRNQIRPGMKLVVGFLKVKPAQSALASKAVQSTAATAPAPVVSPAPNNQPKAPIPPAQEELPGTSSINFNGGFFRSNFRNGSKTASGSATIFRSTSGWQDGKYYALMDNVPVGTIVQIKHAGTNKIVYAKVLGQLSAIKENAGLLLRVSNAAAAELGAGNGDSRFTVEVRF